MRNMMLGALASVVGVLTLSSAEVPLDAAHWEDRNPLGGSNGGVK